MVDPDPFVQGLLQVGTTALEVAATWLVVAKAAKETSETFEKYANHIGRQIDGRRRLGEAKELLGIAGAGQYLYRSDNHHPLYGPGRGLHPDNLAALLAAGGGQYRRARQQGTAETPTEVWGGLDQNLVLIGSPTSEGLSRIAFGYSARDSNPDELFRSTDAPVDLPYVMTLDRGDIAMNGTARRYVCGRGAVSRPNWRINGPRESFVPQTDRDGWLETDYLLVTRMPNFLSPAGLARGHHIVSIAGTHGTGTRAIERLVNSRELLRRLAGSGVGIERTPFQAVFRVSGIKHHPAKGSVGTRIELVSDPVGLTTDFGVWEQASRQVQSSLGDWGTTPSGSEHS